VTARSNMHRSSRDVGGLEKGQRAGGSVDFACACERERAPARARERAREIRHETRENESQEESLHVVYERGADRGRTTRDETRDAPRGSPEGENTKRCGVKVVHVGGRPPPSLTRV